MLHLRQKQKKSGRSVSHLITNHWLLITALAPALSGCMGVYEGGFECPPGEGVGCKSISEVNHMVDQGLGSKNTSSTSAQKTKDDEPVCKRGSGSCSASLEIWYAPAFEVQRNEKCQTKDLDDQFSI
ncbi:hypothetical protein QM565_32545 [Geitlerinema splendidum]|nr:hypothetical protein [Geitlerinema splendidum]